MRTMTSTLVGQAPALSTEDLSVGYGKTVVVDGIRIRVEAGEILCLIGPNGAGKSTILKTLIRQLRPMEGTVLLEDTPLSDLKERELARKSAAVLTGRIARAGSRQSQKKLHDRGLSRAVGADQPHCLSVRDLKGHL